MESQNQKDKKIFHSQTYGSLQLEQIHKKVAEFMEIDPDSRYRIIIGADSQEKKGSQTDFVTAIIIHRVGAGAIYFWKRTVDDKKRMLKQRIYEEAYLAMNTAEDVLVELKENGIKGYEFEVHVDIGKNGPTREVIKEVVGMIRGSGFNVKTKPEAYGASKVADKHT